MISETSVTGVLQGMHGLCATGFDVDGPTPGPDFLHQVAAALTWISGDSDRARVVLRRGSYALKHIIERDVGTYIPNGAAIVAGALAGFQIVRAGEGPNCRFRRPG